MHQLAQVMQNSKQKRSIKLEVYFNKVQVISKLQCSLNNPHLNLNITPIEANNFKRSGHPGYECSLKTYHLIRMMRIMTKRGEKNETGKGKLKYPRLVT